MAKIDPFSLKRTPKEPRYIEAVDPDYPDAPLGIWLQPLGLVEDHLSFDIAQRLISNYVTGDMVFPPVDGKEVKLSETLCKAISALCMMQCPKDPKDLYSVEELLAFTATMEVAMDHFIGVAAEMNAAYKVGNALRVATVLSSGSPSSTTNDTQP